MCGKKVTNELIFFSFPFLEGIYYGENIYSYLQADEMCQKILLLLISTGGFRSNK